MTPQQVDRALIAFVILLAVAMVAWIAMSAPPASSLPL